MHLVHIPAPWCKAFSTVSTCSDMIRFITTYSDQHGQIRGIMNKHWHLLSSDLTLCKYIKEYPEITFKWSGSIRDRLVRSHYTRNKDKQGDRPGVYRCGSCDYCELLLEGSPFQLPNGRIHSLKHHATCQTKGVIYITLCQCGAFYVCKTMRPLWKRMKDHYYYATVGNLNTPIGHHIAFQHNYHPYVF